MPGIPPARGTDARVKYKVFLVGPNNKDRSRVDALIHDALRGEGGGIPDHQHRGQDRLLFEIFAGAY